MSANQPVRQHIADRVKARFAGDLKGLDDAAATMIHEVEMVRQEIAEAQATKGGQVFVSNENRISNAYRNFMKKVGILQGLQQSGVFNVIPRGGS